MPFKYIVRRIGGNVIYHRKKDKKWEVSARHFLEGKQLILNFDEHKLVRSRLTEQELNFIRPLVD